MPDLHWHIGEGAERETIAKATSARRSRRSWLALLIVVILGAGLGILYRSLPESTPQPTPTPSPTLRPMRPAVPAKLYEVIDQEAQALADGDFATYFETQQGGREAQRENFTAWGRPDDDRSLYVIVDFDLPTDISAWADIRQFREGRYFRETHFYYRGGDGWRRISQPDVFPWSGQKESIQTPHFDVTYAVEDRDVISLTLRQLEEDYQALCRDLGCMALGRELTFTLKMDANNSPYNPYAVSGRELRLPSPRVMGFFESGRAYTWKSNFMPHWVLALEIGKRVHGLRFDGATDYDQPGSGLLWAVIFWAIDRIDPLPAEFQRLLGDLKQKPLLSLETLWEIGEIDEPGLALAQLYHLVHFIEQEYGASAVTHLLGAIASAKSLSEAIENGLGVPFAEFEQKWQMWAKANITDQ